MSNKLAILQELYDASHIKGLYACQKGCHTCCTQNVTISGLEGELIYHHLAQNGQNLITSKLSPTAKRPTLTSNEYVKQFIKKNQPPQNESEEDYSQACQFLDNGQCSIYSVRPYMCRGFLSIHNCQTQGYADIPPQILAFNTIMGQIIEHISEGEPWGLMDDVLEFIGMRNTTPADAAKTARLLVCRKSPGFLLTTNEKLQLKKMLDKVETVIIPHQHEQKSLENLLLLF